MKILIIGQALPKVKQAVPYDTTMLYDWLAAIGITKEQAQELFEFEAMCPYFPGADEAGHKKPTPKQMRAHFDNVLADRIRCNNKVIALGNVARGFLADNSIEIHTINPKLAILNLIHPSKRNWNLYQNNKHSIHDRLKAFIKLKND